MAKTARKKTARASQKTTKGEINVRKLFIAISVAMIISAQDKQEYKLVDTIHKAQAKVEKTQRQQQRVIDAATAGLDLLCAKRHEIFAMKQNRQLGCAMPPPPAAPAAPATPPTPAAPVMLPPGTAR